MDNRKDIEDWNEAHELRKLAEAYAKAAAEYLALEEKETRLYRVQVGAYRQPENAKAMQEKLLAAGYDAIIV